MAGGQARIQDFSHNQRPQQVVQNPRGVGKQCTKASETFRVVLKLEAFTFAAHPTALRKSLLSAAALRGRAGCGPQLRGCPHRRQDGDV